MTPYAAFEIERASKTTSRSVLPSLSRMVAKADEGKRTNCGDGPCTRGCGRRCVAAAEWMAGMVDGEMKVLLGEGQ